VTPSEAFWTGLLFGVGIGVSVTLVIVYSHTTP
jgi:hypothetical protein